MFMIYKLMQLIYDFFIIVSKIVGSGLHIGALYSPKCMVDW